MCEDSLTLIGLLLLWYCLASFLSLLLAIIQANVLS